MIRPLCIPQTNWQAFIGACQAVLGYSPTRGLDEGIFPKHNDPPAFLGCLDLENKPLEALQKRELYKHVSLSFIGDFSNTEILYLTKYTNLNIYYRGLYDEHIGILSGTLDQWLDSILIGCSARVEKPMREIMNETYDQFCVLGFKSIFKTRKKQYVDGTFILV
jgi:hypothetical protein